MVFVWNLGLPWLLIWAVALLQPSTIHSHHWILQGLKDNLSLYGFAIHSPRLGYIGLFLPLVIIHNLVFLSTRFIQSRIQLDFLPMIRNVLLWVGMLLLAYLCWLSFNRGAKYGDFHQWSLFILPFFAFNLGLAFFVHKDKYWAAAQITALMVAWSPVFSIVSSLAGNHLRPHSLFEEVVIEPNGQIWGFSAGEAKTRFSEYVRLRLIKEGTQVNFPSLARHIKVSFDSNGRAREFSADLDPVSYNEIANFPEQLEELGWRALGDNQNALTTFCSLANSQKSLEMPWTKADSILKLRIDRCAPMAEWSLSTSAATFSLGELDFSKAQRMSEQRAHDTTSLKEIDLGLLKNQDWRQRKLGIELVAAVNSEEAPAMLVQGFYDLDIEVRQAAATALLSWGNKAEPYLSKALSDSNPTMRGDALRILAKINRLQPHPAALKLLSDPVPYVKISAVRALAAFSRENTVIKTLMSKLSEEYDQSKSPEAFLNDEFYSELVVTLAQAKDVRTASLLLKVLPQKWPTVESAAKVAAQEAALALREMKTWTGTDYLQSMARRGTVLQNRQKALAIMARWKESGDEEVFVRSLKDEALRPYALELAPYFESPATRLVLKELQSAPAEEPAVKLQAR